MVASLQSKKYRVVQDQIGNYEEEDSHKKCLYSDCHFTV